jgi:alkylmercury lyase
MTDLHFPTANGHPAEGGAPTGELEAIAERLAAPFKALPRAEALLELYPAVLNLLARGKPVAPQELAAAVGRPVTEVLKDLQIQRSTEYTDNGDIAGYGLTLRETQHRVTVDGATLYTWCALDTLMYPVVLGRPFEIESPCKETGAPVRVRVSPDGVESVSPPAAVVSIVVPDDLRDARGSFCNYVHYFVSPEAAGRWLAQHPEGLLLSVEDAFTVGALRLHQILGVSTSGQAHAGAEAGQGCCA